MSVRNGIERVESCMTNGEMAYTMNQAMKKIPIANKTIVSCGYIAGLTGLTYLLIFSITALDCSNKNTKETKQETERES